MPLIPKIQACLNSCSGITIKDITGFYNVVSNPFAWNNNSTLWKTIILGTPQLVSATITITFNDVQETPVSVLTAIQGSIFPNYLLLEYTPVNSEGTSLLKDGHYNIKLTLTDINNVVYVTDTDITVWCNVECCIQKLSAKVASELCNTCDTEAYDTFVLADGMFTALKAVSECNGTQEFNKLLTKLQKLCGVSTGDCGCGCS